MDNRSSIQRIVAVVGVILLIGAGLSVVPAILAQDGGSGAPTPGADDDIDCGEFDNRQEVNEVYNPDNDQYRLDDGDEDATACENVGGGQATEEPAGTSTPTATETATPTATATEEAAETATETATEETTETETETPTENETEMEQPTASVTFSNQTTDGTTVVVESVTMSEGGFVAIHNASLLDGNTLGSVVGVSEPLSAGTHENVEVTLFDVPGQNFSEGMTLEENQTLIAMPHFDTNSNGVYDFITSNASEDGPYTANGSAVVDPASITIDDGADDADGQPAGDDIGQNDEDDDSDGAVDEDGEDNNDVPSNDDDDGDGAVDEDDELDDGNDGSDDMNGEAEDDDDGDGAYDEDDEADGGNSDDEDNDGDGAVDEDDEPDSDD
jgi:hypothetical protein